MADTPIPKTLLQKIVDAKINETYLEEIARDHEWVKRLATKLLSSDTSRCFESAVTDHQQLRNSQIALRDTNYLSGEALAATTQIVSALEQLKTLPDNKEAQRNKVASFRKTARAFIEAWAILLPTIDSDEGRLQNLTKLEQNAAENVRKIEGLLHAAQNAAQKTGGSRHASTFGEAKAYYESKARIWLITTIASAALLIASAFASIFLYQWLMPKGYIEISQMIVTKVLTLSVIFYFVSLSSRSYRANAHLAAINKHREVALACFETFVKSATDDQTMNAILLETTRCIYAHTPTGHLPGEDGTSSTQIIEIMKAIGPGAAQSK